MGKDKEKDKGEKDKKHKDKKKDKTKGPSEKELQELVKKKAYEDKQRELRRLAKAVRDSREAKERKDAERRAKLLHLKKVGHFAFHARKASFQPQANSGKMSNPPRQQMALFRPNAAVFEMGRISLWGSNH